MRQHEINYTNDESNNHLAYRTRKSEESIYVSLGSIRTRCVHIINLIKDTPRNNLSSEVLAKVCQLRTLLEEEWTSVIENHADKRQDEVETEQR
jgi:hypothetical protein